MLIGKDRFVIQFTSTDGDKILTITTRWKNTLNDSKSGHWNEEVSARVDW